MYISGVVENHGVMGIAKNPSMRLDFFGDTHLY